VGRPRGLPAEAREPAHAARHAERPRRALSTLWVRGVSIEGASSKLLTGALIAFAKSKGATIPGVTDRDEEESS